ncbi:hypothetical protein CHUAL_011572 [Chamberlinius hualienensis]
MESLPYCIISGLFASCASLSAKYAMGGEESLRLCEIIFAAVEKQPIDSSINHYPHCKQWSILVRLVFVCLMLLFNCLMWTTFVKALRHSRTSLQATVTNTAANFIFTALFGHLFFGEFLPLVWWLGSLLIIFGWVLMHQQQKNSRNKKYL